MIARLLFCGVLVTSFVACKTPYAKSDKKEARERNDQSGDPAFQSFVGRLRKAIAARDMVTLQSMMARDFGYRWDAPTEPENAFSYWDKNELWPELNAVVHQPFEPYGDFMVAPPGFAQDPANYKGYRAGLRLENGSWRFAYFIAPEGLQ